MSDETDLAAESAEATQSGAEPDAPSTEAPPPWGDDFDPERAWKTITHLRGREKELESDAKLLKQIREDEEARREFLTEMGYELEPEEEEALSEDEPSEETRPDPRVEAHDEWIRKQQEAQALRDFNEDLDKAAGELEEVTLTERDRRTILAESMANGFNPDATRKALKELVEDRKDYDRQLLERYRESKKAPHVSPAGKSATQVPDLDKESDRHAWLREQAARRSAEQ